MNSADAGLDGLAPGERRLSDLWVGLPVDHAAGDLGSRWRVLSRRRVGTLLRAGIFLLVVVSSAADSTPHHAKQREHEPYHQHDDADGPQDRDLREKSDDEEYHSKCYH